VIRTCAVAQLQYVFSSPFNTNESSIWASVKSGVKGACRCWIAGLVRRLSVCLQPTVALRVLLTSANRLKAKRRTSSSRQRQQRNLLPAKEAVNQRCRVYTSVSFSRAAWQQPHSTESSNRAAYMMNLFRQPGDSRIAIPQQRAGKLTTTASKYVWNVSPGPVLSFWVKRQGDCDWTFLKSSASFCGRRYGALRQGSDDCSLRHGHGKQIYNLFSVSLTHSLCPYSLWSVVLVLFLPWHVSLNITIVF
jgi:hypothetical protein